MFKSNPSPTVLIVGDGTASATAALDLAQAGIGITLLTAQDWLTSEDDGLADVPTLLAATRHSRIQLLRGATIQSIQPAASFAAGGVSHHLGVGDGRGLRVTVGQSARYVDAERCTACGACDEVCPVWLPGGNGSGHHKAIYRGGIPTSYAIDKAGTAPCRDACPIDQRAQGYVALVCAGEFQAAYDCIKRDNPFPSICGRVCNHRCEDACSRGKADAPVNIMGLKRFVTDWARGHGANSNTRRADTPDPTGKKVAVIGAGPAGLTCALDLVRQGHAVTIYEALPVAGGMMRVGVPEYRLPYDLVQREIDDILDEGVELKLNHRVEDVPGLLKDGFDAVFVAVGAHAGAKLPIPGADLPESMVATEFLRAISLASAEWPPSGSLGMLGKAQGEVEAPGDEAPTDIAEWFLGRRVLVLGGGNVAIDAAMGAVRLGASWVGMMCLESRDRMPAHEWEILDAEEEGIEIFPSRSFKEITSDEGHVTGLRCAQIDFHGFKDGRPDFDELIGAEEVIGADVVIFAIGQRPQIDCLQDQVETIHGRFPLVDPETLATSLAGVFAGGDAVTGTAFIVDAIAAGQKAARSIDCYLKGRELAVERDAARLPPIELDETEVRHRLVTGQARPTGRIEMKKRPAQERRQDFGEVYAGLTEAEAKAEAARCLNCGVCSECLQCEDACAAGAISHEQRPRTWELPVGVVIWADANPPISALSCLPAKDLSGLFVVGNGLSLGDAVDQTLSLLDISRPAPTIDLAAPSRWQFLPQPMSDTQSTSHSTVLHGLGTRKAQVGVFLCRCGGEIERAVDLSAIALRVKDFPGVAFVEQVDFACHPLGGEVILAARSSHHLDGAVLAACSCCALDQICYSCTTQRLRCKERLGVWDGFGLPLQFVNVREQCAFVHRGNPEAATLKAGDLVTASIAALSMGGGMNHQSAEVHLPSLAPRTDGRGGAVQGRGMSHASRFPITASIDLVRCRGCEDCESICGLQAVQVVGSNGARFAQVDPYLCLGCGVCMAVCSSGAIRASDASDAQVHAQLSSMGDLSDKTVVFSCNWGAYSAVEAAGVQRMDYDPSIRLVRLMCSGRAHDGLILQAFTQGAARVMVLTCGHDGDRSTPRCRYQTGSDQAKRSVEQAQRMLRLLGIDPARLAVVEMEPGDGARFVAAVKEFTGTTMAVVPEGKI
jgi:NADPH-dependent glutamate synthase beta subunit-like oxidoreductase/coenzyme F420-reducing hydrogenase delta subunit/NAD-dependent dihydropyrimidine dehydrogenase PreA subunit